MIWHVIPENDLQEHLEVGCECHPKVVIHDGDMIIVHNAYDGRL